MTSLLVHPQTQPLKGRVPVPSDREITHRALVLAALCNGFSTLRGYGFSQDTEHTRSCLEKLGVDIEVNRDDKSLRVRGVGLYGLTPPKGVLACGESRTTLMLLAGLLSAQDFESELTADGLLARAPLQELAAPLRQRGGQVSARGRGLVRGDATAPLLIGALPDEKYLEGIEWQSERPDAALKGALLLSGLFAHGDTLLREGALSPDHLERLFFSLDLPIRASGPLVMLSPAGWSGSIASFECKLPGDSSAAAVLIAAGCLVPGSHVEVRGVLTNVARSGFGEALHEMRASYTGVVRTEELGEMVSDLASEYTELLPVSLGGERCARTKEDLCTLAALAALANGRSRFTDLASVVSESPGQLDAVVNMLRAFGRDSHTASDVLTVEGRGGTTQAAQVSSGGDPSIAMAAVLLALKADGPSRIDDVDCIHRVFPRFVGTMRALGAQIEVA